MDGRSSDSVVAVERFNGKEAPKWFAVNDGVIGGLSKDDGAVNDGSSDQKDAASGTES